MSGDSRDPEIAHWPSDWPERNWVNLDSLGDPGWWLRELVHEPSAWLFGDPDSDEGHAESLASAYTSEMSRAGWPVRTHTGDSEEETFAQIRDEFVGFIREWRKRALASLPTNTPQIGGADFHTLRPVSTWQVLRLLGFLPDGSVLSDPSPGLRLSMGELSLTASLAMSERFQPIVLVLGSFHTARTHGEVHIELPRDLESQEQCAAWLAWHLDRAALKGLFSGQSISWLEIGRANQHRLPWVAEQAAYYARPACTVAREWAKLAMKSLASALAEVPDDTLVMIGFDGAVLRLICGGRVIALAAEGERWGKSYQIAVGQLRRLPTRLMTPMVEFSVWNGSLQIGRNVYRGVVASDADRIAEGRS